MPGFPAAPVVVASNHQATLRGVLMGKGSDYPFSRKRSIEGLGQPPRRTHDFTLANRDGADGGDDDDDVRVVSLPLYIAKPTPEAAMSAYKTLIPVWAKSDTNLELRLRLPGWNEFYLMGRPRGLDADLSQLPYGYIELLARFDALDPTIYYVI